MPYRTLLIVALALSLAACASTVPNRDPLGQAFPAVGGTSLAGEATNLAASPSPRVMIVGYTRKAQFDIDRWLLGLAQLKTPVRGLEVPTIAGWWPGLFSDRIDAGMRRGIPEQDWPSVVTVYDDAEAIVALTGNERPNNARVFLVDGAGRIAFFDDRGYSPTSLLELDRLARVAAAGREAAQPGP